jgi:TolB-like protein/Tfp pilus assembly protein PilF
MEYVEGQTLAAKISGRPLPIAEIVDIGIQVADALDEAHRKGIMHRDIKPANLMLTSREQVKILDFGLAKVTLPEGQALGSDISTVVKTETGVVMGTVQYMSPEQVLGKDVDHRTDIFSLGVVLYEMATGRLPFTGTSSSETMDRVLHGHPEPITRFNYDVPAELERIIRKCLEKDRERRYQSARDLLIDLKSLKRGIESGGATAEMEANETWPRRLTSRRREFRSYQWAVLAALVTLVVAALSVVYLMTSRKPIDSLAVLPFVNDRPTPDTEYISDGITEGLINSLSELSDLKVIARSSVFQYKGSHIDVQSVGKRFGVRAVLTGTIAQLGDDLIISVELSDVRDRRHIWGERYRKPLADILVLQDNISRAVTDRLRLKLSVEENKLLTKRYTSDTEAYRLYLQGRYYLNQRSAEAIGKAQEFFNQAIEKDPDYAYAYSGLSDSYALLAAQGALSPKEAYPKAMAAAKKAVELDKTLAEAHTSLAHARLHTNDYTGAEQEFEHALHLKPNYATAHHWYAEYLDVRGRQVEAIAAEKRALELDPLDLATNAMLGGYFSAMGRLDESVAQYQKTLEIKSNYFLARMGLGKTYLKMGKYQEAVVEFRQVISLTKGNRGHEYLARAYVRLGRRQAARELLNDRLKQAQQKYVDPFAIAVIYAALEDKEQVFVWLRKAVGENPAELEALKRDDAFDNLRSDARYVALLRQ